MSIGLGPYLRLVAIGVLSHGCPACGRPHTIETWRGPRKNEWDHNSLAPTFSGEIRQQVGDVTCIYRIAAGRIEFSNESTHILAGRSFPLPIFLTHRSLP